MGGWAPVGHVPADAELQSSTARRVPTCGQPRLAERRAPTCGHRARRAPESAEHRAPSAERQPVATERRARRAPESAEHRACRAPSAERRAPTCGHRAPSVQSAERRPVGLISWAYHSAWSQHAGPLPVNWGQAVSRRTAPTGRASRSAPTRCVQTGAAVELLPDEAASMPCALASCQLRLRLERLSSITTGGTQPCPPSALSGDECWWRQRDLSCLGEDAPERAGRLRGVVP